jgi:hypothetical protein
MRKIYTRGIDLAHKSMLMSAIAYNLKKYMKYAPRIINLKVESALNPIEKLYNLICFQSLNNIFRFSFS